MTCQLTGKQQMSRGDALRKIRELAPGDPDATALNAYKCPHCGRHHVGHRRVDDRAPRRLNR